MKFRKEDFDALLTFFTEYNFTIDESDPVDVEIGIDPEMLGKIFENLLEDNKDKGAFYTPKEIVQYMCRESLIAYLDVRSEMLDVRSETLDVSGETLDVRSETLDVRSETLDVRRETLDVRSGGEDEHKELRGFDCLAKGDGFDGGDLSTNKTIAERGAVFATRSDETSGSVDSVKHSGGLREKKSKRISEIPSDSQRFCNGIGNTTEDLSENRLSNGRSNEKVSKSSNRNSENDFSTNYNQRVISNEFCTSSKIRNFVLTHDASQFTQDEKRILLKALFDVKVCDPAVGSGAFPMGMMNELLGCIKALVADGLDVRSEALDVRSETVDVRSETVDVRSEVLKSNDYRLMSNIKKHIVKNNIYGVDIEKGAVDIARLRFWLAIIVDEKEPIPLPNLDYKIMQGNSLLESYKGVDLSCLTEIDANELDFGADEIADLVKAIDGYYMPNDQVAKNKIRKNIQDKVIALLKAKGFAQEKDFYEQLSKIDLHANSEFFLWHTWFGDVFNRPNDCNGGETLDIRSEVLDVRSEVLDIRSEVLDVRSEVLDIRSEVLDVRSEVLDVRSETLDVSGGMLKSNDYRLKSRNGFDIVIGNPPYRIVPKDDKFKVIYDNKFSVAHGGKRNLYHLFFEQGVLLLRKDGILSFITPDTYFSGNDTTALRKFFVENTNIKNIIHYTEKDRVFENVTQAVAVAIMLKQNHGENFHILVENKNEVIRYESLTEDNNYIFKSSNSVIERMEKCEQTFNDVCNGYQGEVNLTQKKDYIAEKRNKNTLPLVRGIQITKYGYEKGIEYCSLDAASRNHTNIERIVFQEVSNMGLAHRIKGTILNNVICGHSTNYIFSKIVKIDNRFILAVLNSKAVNYYFKFFNQTNHVPIGELKQIPFPSASSAQQKPIIALVDKILASKKADTGADTAELEREIDCLVYALYGLTDDEIAIIEQK